MAYGETYEQFVEKFKPKLTTDDCMTPDNVYDVIADYVADRYNVKKDRFVRPFWPGADYKERNYGPDDIVVDNPPFSISSKICKYYQQEEIPFFLFTNGLTATGKWLRSYCVIFSANIIYENGANVLTAFVTNMEEPGIVLDAELRERIANLYPSKAKKKKKTCERELNAARLNKAVVHGAQMKLFPEQGSGKYTDGTLAFGGSVKFSEEEWERLEPFTLSY